MLKKLSVIIFALMLAASFTACEKSAENSASVVSTAGTSNSGASANESREETVGSEASASVSTTKTEQVISTVNTKSGGKLEVADLFTERDLTQTADTEGAAVYTVSDNQNITITSAGVYILTGSASNVTVTVEAADEDKVQLLLDGVSITNDSSPCIYVKNADKIFVTTSKDKENTLSVTGSFTADGDTNTDAAVFSKDDLVLNGLGTLNISSTDNGVSCKDDLKITGGTISINCSSDAIEANDSISVSDGKITINSQKDGLHSENDEDNSVGSIYICGGTLEINAGSDAVQATTVCQIDGGTLNLTAGEGIEATYVQINDGEIKISASDDGINGSNKSNAYSVTIEINGGNITVDMGQGDTDGIDSNGDLYINGGTITVNAQSPFDYDGTAQKNGGTIIVNGTETDTITNQMMGGGMGGMGRGGQMPGGQMPGGQIQGGFGNS